MAKPKAPRPKTPSAKPLPDLPVPGNPADDPEVHGGRTPGILKQPQPGGPVPIPYPNS
jgi:hypothetical protein